MRTLAHGRASWSSLHNNNNWKHLKWHLINPWSGNILFPNVSMRNTMRTTCWKPKQYHISDGYTSLPLSWCWWWGLSVFPQDMLWVQDTDFFFYQQGFCISVTHRTIFKTILAAWDKSHQMHLERWHTCQLSDCYLIKLNVNWWQVVGFLLCCHGVKYMWSNCTHNTRAANWIM